MPSEAAHLTAAASPLTFPDGSSFRASPLTDRDLAELDEWVQSRAVAVARRSLAASMSQAERDETMQAAVAEAATLSWMSGRGSRVMAEGDGVAELLWRMIRRNHPEATPTALRARYFDDSDPMLDANYDAVIEKLRELHGLGSDSGGTAAGGKSPSKSDVYRALATRFGYTPNEIAELTPAQQAALLSEDRVGSNQISFRTMAEFETWKAQQGK